jgi:hypothetical protein
VPPKNILSAHQAPPWQPARSEVIVLWHGTLSIFRHGIESGIDLSKCAVDTDFGRGFYTTTVERQARFWAWDRFNRWLIQNPTTGGTPHRDAVQGPTVFDSHTLCRTRPGAGQLELPGFHSRRV